MAFTNIIPNFVIMAPKDFYELEQMLEFAVNLNKPVLLRYPRGKEDFCFEKSQKIELGKAEILSKGKDVTIFAIGKMVAKAIKVSKLLEESGISSTIINSRFLKPFDEDVLIQNTNKLIVSIEDGTAIGGLGSKIKDIAIKNNLDINLEVFAYPDEFIKHGSVAEIEEKYGLDAITISDIIIQKMKLKKFEIINKMSK